MNGTLIPYLLHFFNLIKSALFTAPKHRFAAMDTHSCPESLPGELRHAVLCFLPNAPSLNALVHASPSFHHFFVEARSVIVPAVLSNQILLNVIPQAVAIWQSSHN